MFKIIAITNRFLCDDFEKRLKELADNNITFILREKDLSEEQYTALAKRVLEFTDNFIMHTFIDVARKLGHKKIHLTMNDFLNNDVSEFNTVGVSTHSIEEAIKAQENGASYITTSHIFATDCKKGIEPKGISFLENVCNSVKIPVYALGGINGENIELIKRSGADGACIMSHFMKCTDINIAKQILETKI